MMVSKEQAYELMHKALHACVEEGTDRTAVVVLIDNEQETVRVYGLNVIAEDVPQLLMEVAEEVFDQETKQAMRRKLN
jgi:hypothetical protein